MTLFQRHRWFFAAAGITLAFTVVSLTAHKSDALTAFADAGGLLVIVLAAGVTLAIALRSPGPERGFWLLMTLGFSLWACNQGSWAYNEIVARRPIPDPSDFDIVLFFHLSPMIAAVGWRPDFVRKEGRMHLSLLTFLMLVGWWIFLYAFVVFPSQYVLPNVESYNKF